MQPGLLLSIKKISKLSPDHRFICCRISYQPLLPVVLEKAILKLDQADAILGENFSSPLVISSSLLSAITATACFPFVEDRDRFGMLPLPVLYNEFQLFIICVNGELGVPATFLCSVAEQEVEPMVTLGLQTEQLVAKADYIVLVLTHAGSIAEQRNNDVQPSRAFGIAVTKVIGTAPPLR